MGSDKDTNLTRGLTWTMAMAMHPVGVLTLHCPVQVLRTGRQSCDVSDRSLRVIIKHGLLCGGPCTITEARNCAKKLHDGFSTPVSEVQT